LGKNIQSLPPIKNIKRESKEAYRVLYDKGCVYLFWLEKELGINRMNDFLAAIADREITNTYDFLKCLESFGGKKIADEFTNKLER